jgi:hypothetical protein
VHSACVVTGVSVTCNNELCLHLCVEHVDATFSATECVLTFFGAVCVLFCYVFCSYERSIGLVLFYVWWIGVHVLLHNV